MSPKKEQKAKGGATQKTSARKENFQAPKGMRDIWGKEYFAMQGFFEKAAEIALYYGFQPITTPTLEHEEVFTSGIGEGTDIVEKELYRSKTKGGDQLALRPEGTAGVMRSYLEHGMQSLSQPVMFYYEETFFRHDKPQRGRLREFRQFGLEMIGTDRPIADALVIKVIMTILEEAGMTGLALRLNSIGDKDCRASYRRELVNYYRKHIAKICGDCDRRLRDNPLRLLDCKVSECQPIKEHAPEAIAYLCEACKKHLKEVIEYLESMGISYTIDKTLVRGLDYYSRTVFEIINEEKLEKDSVIDGAELAIPPPVSPNIPLSLASGGRYDGLARMLDSNRDVSAVGGAIGVDRVISSPEYANLAPRILKKPKVFFIQLGYDAKLKSVDIIEILRNAKVSVMHSLSKDSLSAQLANAEKLGIPYTILLGQKEVMEKTVIVRDMSDRSQKSVKIKDLLVYLKNLK